MNAISSLLRRQLRTPLFALIVTVLVAAVVAFNASAFSAIHALRWKALPYVDGERLVELQARLVNYGFDVGLTENLRQAVIADTAHFSGALGVARVRGGGEDGRTWQMARVTENFQQVLGIAPALGRGFQADDARAGNDAVILLGDAIWRSRFNADPQVIGKDIRFTDRVYRVIGVMPPSFAFPDASIEAWRPFVMSDAERELNRQGNVGMIDVVARMAPGVELEQAQVALDAILARDASLDGLRSNAGVVAGARAWRDRYASGYFHALTWLQIAALILLVAVLANLVNLQLDRLLVRRRELDVRRALGASERSIAKTVLADLAPPVVLGVVLGLVLTPALLRVLVSRDLLPQDLPQGVTFGAASLSSALLVGVITMASGLIAALVSARASQLSSRSGVGGMGRLRPAMLVAQVMLTTALLGSEGLLLRSALNLSDADRGFDSRGVLLTLVDPVGVTTAGAAFDPATDATRYAPVAERIHAAVASLPGINRVAVSTAPPFSGWEMVGSIRMPNQPDNLQARTRSVGPGYLSTLGIGLLAGREFNDADHPGSSGVIVDELFRRRFLQGVDPLSAYVELATDAQGGFRRAPIIGVARTVKHESLDETDNLPTVYQFNAAPLPVFWLVSHASGDPAAIAESVRRAIQQSAPGTTVGTNEPLATRIASTLGSRRALIEALGGFALGALLLAAIGLAAVLSFSIRRRNAEMGVRMAMGATRGRIRAMIMRQGGNLVVVGLLLGLGLGLAVARAMSGRLIGVPFNDPLTWSLVLGLVGVIAGIACWLPASRAAATDPMVALRRE